MSTTGHRNGTANASTLETSLKNIAHLFRRAGFGATPSELVAAAQAGLDTAIAHVVDFDSIPDPFNPPDLSQYSADMKNRNVESITAWWLTRMLTTARPLQEKMTLFWHGHFATAEYKVGRPVWMYNQNALFRTQGMGRFDDLLTAVYKDPAMLVWLDGSRNTKTAPNENFGREVMELFTLGRGNFTEDDVHANARAFTGWRIDDNGNAVFVPRAHDDGVKTLLGQTGNWGPDDAVRILCAHPATGPFLAGRLWHFFGSDSPSDTVISRMAKTYYATDHSIREMLRSMFSSPEFYATGARTAHVKSPTEFLITTLRQLGLTNVDMTPYPRILAQLGQELFNPPNVGGWPGGPSWINAGTMLMRFNVASRITGDFTGSTGVVDPDAILAASDAGTLEQLANYIAETLGISMSATTEAAILRYSGKSSIDDSAVDTATKIRGLLHLVMTSPEYQIA